MTTIRAPVKTGEKSFAWTDLQMYDPHNIVRFLFGPDVGMVIQSALVERFWHLKRDVEKEDWAVAHPAEKTHIPIALYGDSAQLYPNQNVKVLGLFISFPLWRCLSNRCSRWCIFAIEESKLWKTDTLDAVLRRVTYSMNLCFDGLDPTDNFVFPYKFAMTELRGDWLFMRQVFAWASSWTSPTTTCFRCTARGGWRGDGSEVFYNHWDDTPNWHHYNTAEFINDQLGGRRSPCP